MQRSLAKTFLPGRRLAPSLLLLSCFSLLSTFALPAPASSVDLPPPAVKTPPQVKEESVSTYVPSEAAPGQGLAVNLIFCNKPRYKDSAPVVVVVPGGNASQGLDFSMHAAHQGFVEVRFAFPGGGKPGFTSSGIYDNRGLKSQEALRDVLRFAAGQITDHQNKKISELLPYHTDPKSVGAVGWSNGGNTLLVTLGKFAAELPFVSWVAFYESPVGAMFFPPALGGAHDMLANKHYRPGTAATGQVMVDFRKLKYQKDASKAPGLHKKNDEPEIPGVAYFDENNNGAWDETSEFAIPYATDIGMEKQIYPPPVARALWALNDFQLPKGKDGKPKGDASKLLPPVATVDESLAYFRERDGSHYIKSIVQENPMMAFCIFGSHLDHLQRQPDHPHVAMLYNQLLEAKPKFLRLNPSSVYVAAVTFMKASTFSENRPNASIESDTIDQHLEPEGLIPDYAYMEAAAAELADRVHVGKWNKVIEEPYVPYINGRPPAPKPDAAKKTEGKEGNQKDAPPDESAVKDEPGKDKAKHPDIKVKTRSKELPAPEAPKGKELPGEASSPKDWPFRK